MESSDPTLLIDNYLENKQLPKWKIFHFSNRRFGYWLPVHLEYEQRVIFDYEGENLITDINRETHLTHYLKLNQTNDVARELYYNQMPQRFIWNNKNKQWIQRLKYTMLL